MMQLSDLFDFNIYYIYIIYLDSHSLRAIYPYITIYYPAFK